jgi:hypothetical protein
MEFSVTLPSRGLLYGDKLPGGKITVKSMTTREQSILFNPGGDSVGKFDQVLQNCIPNSPTPVQDLLMTDRLYLMIVLRSKSFGTKYKIPLRCSACRTQYNQEIDLAEDLKMRVYEDPMNVIGENTSIISIGNQFKEPFICTLPISKDVIEYRLLRGYDEKQISIQAKRILMQSIDPSDPSFQLRLSLMIQTINGQKLEPARKLVYIQSMEAGDETFLSNDAENNESGFDLSVLSNCNSCGFSEEVGLPFTAEFFRPRGR